jgi:hypothetical protein
MALQTLFRQHSLKVKPHSSIRSLACLLSHGRCALSAGTIRPQARAGQTYPVVASPLLRLLSIPTLSLERRPSRFFKSHWDTNHPGHGEAPTPPQNKIYDPDALVKLVDQGALTVDSAAGIALSQVESRALELEMVGVWADWWGRKTKVDGMSSTRLPSSPPPILDQQRFVTLVCCATSRSLCAIRKFSRSPRRCHFYVHAMPHCYFV